MKKKNIIIILAIILFFLLCLGIYFLYHYVTPVTLSAQNNVFTLTFPGKIKVKEKKDNSEDYVLDFYSVKGEMIGYTTILPNQGYDLLSLVDNEKKEVVEKLNQVKDISETKPIQIPNTTKAYWYEYTYLNSSTDKEFYSQVIWIQTSQQIYVINLEVITSNKESYLPIFDQIIHSFTEITG